MPKGHDALRALRTLQAEKHELPSDACKKRQWFRQQQLCMPCCPYSSGDVYVGCSQELLLVTLTCSIGNDEWHKADYIERP